MSINNSSKLLKYLYFIDFKRSNYFSNKYKIFNLLFFMALAIPTLSVGLFNFIIDPYGIYNSSDFFGINHEKPEKDNNDRLYKAVDIVRLKPTVIILGSSRAKQGLDPNHPSFKNFKTVYNLGLNGSNIYEQLRYLEHAIATQKNIKKVIFGIDFFMFNANLKNQPTFSENRLNKSYITIQELVNTLFSVDALSASQRTIISSLKQPNLREDYAKNGFTPSRKIDDGKTKWRFKSGIDLYLTLHWDYKLSNQYLADFKRIVDLCREKGIPLKVFISPAHATDLDILQLTGHWQVFEQWKRDIVKITPVWDFSGYNSVTTEPIKDKMKNYSDNSHYSPQIGNLIFDRIFAYQDEKVPKDFGIWLTSENIESELVKLRNDRQEWAKKNPDEVQLLKDIKKSFDKEQKVKSKHLNRE